MLRDCLLCSLQPCDHLLGKGLTSGLSYVWCFLIFLSLSNMVFRVRCSSWLHPDLCLLLTLNTNTKHKLISAITPVSQMSIRTSLQANLLLVYRFTIEPHNMISLYSGQWGHSVVSHIEYDDKKLSFLFRFPSSHGREREREREKERERERDIQTDINWE